MSNGAGKTYSNIYIQLDCLLDTRLGTLTLIDKDIANKILLSGDYHTREEDKFDGVDRTVFKDMYKNRSIETLANSLLTNIMPLLKHLVGVLKEQSLVRPFHDGAQITINLYPYKLPKDDEIEIGRAVSAWMNGLAAITFINYSPEQLTPIHCKNAYSLMIMYDYEEWLETNAQLFLKTQLPEVTMFVPAIYFVNKPTDKELAELEKEGTSPFHAIRALAKTIIDLELIDVAYFSIINEKYSNIKL